MIIYYFTPFSNFKILVNEKQQFLLVINYDFCLMDFEECKIKYCVNIDNEAFNLFNNVLFISHSY